MDIFTRLGEIDNRVIYTLLILVLLAPLVRPIGLPVSIGQHTRKSYEVIDTLQAGDTIMIDVGFTPSGAADVQPQMVAVLKHVLDKGVKVILTAVQTEGPMMTEAMLKPWEEAGKVYGEDFVNLGYLAGGENAIALFCRDIKKAYPYDFRGNPTANLPILQGIAGAKDVDMFLFFTTQNSDMYVRQVTQYNIPIVGGLINTIAPQAEPYVNAGQLTSILVGLKGGAEYETIMNTPGVGVASMDAQSMGHLLIIAFVVLGNVAYFVTRSRNPREKGAAR